MTHQESGRAKAAKTRRRTPGPVPAWAGWASASFIFVFATPAADASIANGDGYFYRMGRDYPVSMTRPAASVTACSFREPVCVHGDTKTPKPALLGALDDLEAARSTLVRAIGLPSPLSDGSLGGSAGFDLYLVDAHDDRRDAAVRTERDEPVIGDLDRASAFAVMASDLTGCARKNLITRALASAIGFGIDAAESVAIRESRAAYLAELVAPCGVVTRPLVDEFQLHPERALFADSGAADPASFMLFPWYLDAALGAGTAGVLPFALTATSRQRTPPGSFTWVDEPDIFDALRGSLGARTPARKLSDLLLDFAVARAFVGDRDDGMHMPETRWTGAAGRVRFDWSVPFTSLPRSLAPTFPIEPTGATFLWVDLKGAPRGSRVTFRAEWEPPVLFRWAIVRVREDGTEASRVTLTGQDGATSAERVIEAIDDMAGLLIVGTNAGDVGLERPFDPDEQPAEPHGYVVTIWGE